jgi:hypothetical protein
MPMAVTNKQDSEYIVVAIELSDRVFVLPAGRVYVLTKHCPSSLSLSLSLLLNSSTSHSVL